MQIHNDIKIEVYEFYPESRLCRLQPIGTHLHGSKVRSIYFAATTVKVSMPSASPSIFGTSAQCAWAFLHHLHSYLSELIHRSKTARGDTVVQHDLCSCLQSIKKKTLSFYISLQREKHKQKVGDFWNQSHETHVYAGTLNALDRSSNDYLIS